jgi:SAM-dependent methyltransferase
MVADALLDYGVDAALLADVGCGSGSLYAYVQQRVTRYIGVDVVKYPGFPAGAEFRQVNLDSGRIDLPDSSVDVAASVETIEHLENPRAFLRELVRLVKPGGLVLVTTPNQLSLLSLLSLLVRREFVAFGPGDYPAHITALLEVDLCRIARECGLTEIGIRYSAHGRVPLTDRRYPEWLARRFGRRLSDNLLLIGRRAADHAAPRSAPEAGSTEA